MAKIEWVHHRLERWSIWRSKGGGMGSGYGACPMWAGAVVDNQVAGPAVIPVADAECSQTEDCIKGLPDELAMTIATYYLHDSQYTQRKLSISPAVLSQRIDRAHRLLAQKFTELSVVTRKDAPDPSWYRGSFTP